MPSSSWSELRRATGGAIAMIAGLASGLAGQQPVVRDTVFRAVVDSGVSRLPTVSYRWMLDYFPSVLLEAGPFGILWWQWLGLIAMIVVASALGKLTTRVVLLVGGRVSRRTKSEVDDTLLVLLRAPIEATATLVIAGALLPLLGLHQSAAEFAFQLVRSGLLFVFFWALLRLIDVARQLLGRSNWARHTDASRTLLPLGGRVVKVLTAAVAAIALLSQFGYPVASLIAGLGIGGLALALAGQKTVENLFGAFSIGVDQPFREGDSVKVNDFVGTVETIGLRSTRFRTGDRTLITIPNGQLAELQVESLSARDRLRFSTIIRLGYDTTTDQIRQVLEGFEKLLEGQPKVRANDVLAQFNAIGESSLEIEVSAWFDTTDGAEFHRIRQDILLGLMEIVDKAGARIAYPTRSVRIESDEPVGPPGPAAATSGR